MIRTYGLTHLALHVRDPDAALRFYGSVLGCVEVYRDEDMVQAQTPGARDVLVFVKDPAHEPGPTGGIAHFGFRLIDAADIESAAALVVAAGGRITCRGEFVPGEPYVFFHDPDGYEVELWYELPTRFDPP